MLRKLSVVLATAILVSCLAGIPVLAEETNSSDPVTTETMERVEDENTIDGESDKLTTESSETGAIENDHYQISSDVMKLNGDTNLAEWDQYVYEIASMDDLVAAFGADNVTVISDTEIKLKRDMIHATSEQALYCFRFIEGTYTIDFNGFVYRARVVWDIHGGDITLVDSGDYGGIISDPILESENSAAALVAIYQRGGNLTVKSGRYVAFTTVYSGEQGNLIIEGGEFSAKGSYYWPSYSALSMHVDINAVIYDGLFEATQFGLWCSNDASEIESDREKIGLKIAGGTYRCEEMDDSSGAIFYEDEDTDQIPDIHSLLAVGYSIQPDTIQSDTKYNGTYAYSKTNRLVRVVFGEGVEGFVYRLYDMALGRNPDSLGYANWVSQLKARTISGAGAAYGFFFSPELQNRNLTDQEFVTLLYSVFFDRKPDDGGLKTWLSAMETGASRKYVFAGFANSQEWKNLCAGYGIESGAYTSDEARDQNLKVTAFVQRLYSLCLNRKADVAGMNNWTAALNSKSQDGAHVAYGFFFSNEFKDQNLSNEDYVEVLYQVLLGRSSDAAGKAGWVQQLSKGTDRLDVFRGFVHSNEFSEICAEYGITRGSI